MWYALVSSFLGIFAFIGTTWAQNFSAQQLLFSPEPLLYARIDPLVDPGENRVSGHVCAVVGASNFSSSATRADLLKSKCTTVQVGNNLDLSAYWKPIFYHVSADGRFSALNMTHSSIYWDLYASEQQFSPLPDDFNMVIGNSSNVNGSCSNGQGLGDGFFYSDFGNSYTIPQKYTSTLGTHITFPDCWDGSAFTLQTQAEHTTFSDRRTGSNCPEGYHRIPGLMLSFAYTTGSEEDFPTNPTGPTYVLSTGDSIGCSLHANFMNGFQTGAWAQILSKCGHLDAGNTDKCSLFNITSQSMQDVDACTYNGTIPDEDVGLVDPIPKLPGCISVGGEVDPDCPQVAFVPATAFVTTPLRQEAGLPIISSGSPVVPPGTPISSQTSIPSSVSSSATTNSPTNSHHAGTTPSASPSAITMAAVTPKSSRTISIVVGVICGVIALVILSTILWFFWWRRRHMAARSIPLVESSNFNGGGNYADYSIDNTQYGGVFKPFRPAELPSPLQTSPGFTNKAFELPSPLLTPRSFKNNAFELPALSLHTPEKSSYK